MNDLFFTAAMCRFTKNIVFCYWHMHALRLALSLITLSTSNASVLADIHGTNRKDDFFSVECSKRLDLANREQ